MEETLAKATIVSDPNVRVLMLVFVIAILSCQVTLARPVFADGLFQENLPPAKIGDRQLSLYQN
jgi:hypothetical protein